MTVFLRALYGPFKRTTDEVYLDDGRLLRGPLNVDWHFFGIREDQRMATWFLRFDLKKRRFQAHSLPMPDKPPLPELVDVFVPNKPMVYGETITVILKTRLSKEEVAFATALSITGRTL